MPKDLSQILAAKMQALLQSVDEQKKLDVYPGTEIMLAGECVADLMRMDLNFMEILSGSGVNEDFLKTIFKTFNIPIMNEISIKKDVHNYSDASNKTSAHVKMQTFPTYSNSVHTHTNLPCSEYSISDSKYNDNNSDFIKNNSDDIKKNINHGYNVLSEIARFMMKIRIEAAHLRNSSSNNQSYNYPHLRHKLFEYKDLMIREIESLFDSIDISYKMNRNIVENKKQNNHKYKTDFTFCNRCKRSYEDTFSDFMPATIPYKKTNKKDEGILCTSLISKNDTDHLNQNSDIPAVISVSNQQNFKDRSINTNKIDFHIENKHSYDHSHRKPILSFPSGSNMNFSNDNQVPNLLENSFVKVKKSEASHFTPYYSLRPYQRTHNTSKRQSGRLYDDKIIINSHKELNSEVLCPNELLYSKCSNINCCFHHFEEH